MTSNTSNSTSEQFNTNSTQSEENCIREALDDDDDESFRPELNDDLSSEAGTIITNGKNLQQIASTSEAGFSVQSLLGDCEEYTEDLERIRRTQKIFKELQFNKPGRQTELISTEKSQTEYKNTRPKRSSKNKNNSRNGESSRNTNKSNNSTNKLFHNQKGLLVTNRGPVDLCDCLSLECSGCNYPCKKCGSKKCSYACRNGRKTFIESIEELKSTIKNPFL